ncbi:MAG: fibronectin type III domain-containing protein [Planctomycetales bacterium]|nr:fibronectin type III domain-containing protein [Planctomycetales bacterium]
MPTFKMFDFEVLQLRYIKSAMDQLPTYLPDGRSATEVQALRDSAEAVKNAYQTLDASLALARGELSERQAEGHLLCVQIYPILKSRYRKDPGTLETIQRLPTEDKTVRATRDRMRAISVLWGQLPNPPGASEPFTPWTGMDQTAFDAALAALVAADEALPDLVQTYERAQSDLHAKLDEVSDFVTAALEQGRAQFPVGSPEREIIEAIPMEPTQQPPAAAVISVAVSPETGQVLLEFDAARATMFDVFQKGPSDLDFVEVATDVIDRRYETSGLASGVYQFRVSGQNSLGNGPLSEPASVNVGGAPVDQLPGPPLAVVFDEVTMSLFTDALPPRATSLRAYRQMLGGVPEVAGESIGVSVSVVQSGPLLPSTSYQFWLVGVNSLGEGPASELVGCEPVVPHAGE